jgi:hypothetical protein
MHIIRYCVSSAALATVIMSGAAVPASSTPLQFGSTNTYFEYVSNPSVSWASAETAAASLSFSGASGYLAVITSAAENNFLASNFTISGSSFEGAWLGAECDPSAACSWEAGPLAGQQFSQGQASVGGAYVNWGGIEPNNSPSAAYMNIGATYAGIGNGQWADAANGLASSGDPVQGYLVEFSTTPLPSTWLMLLSGFVGLGFFAYRGSKKNGAALSAA